ncbi:ferredoxin [Nocardioides sp. GY 10127]|uniref:ferredoxin n=1 Tax=Nocardioides sp. GY 10127 TaxID=2569762 RepID=UPI0010A7CA12|nr:ferredoxin [Nocardioides sp. GY 10127]TIC84460.1 ferredoxin [Nocardioides sp. GY 10127]
MGLLNRRAQRGGVTLEVDFSSCRAAGLCHELLPEVIGLDVWGYPVVDGAPVPPDRVREARAAARACPRLALRVVEA